MKTSSRAGRFKKILVSQEQLALEAPLIESRMAPFLEWYSSGKISDAEFTSLFVITVLSIRSPRQWLGARRTALAIPHKMNLSIADLPFEANIKKRLVGFDLGGLIANFALKSTPETVNRSLLEWSNGNYPLELMFRIPSTSEVLNQQKHGRRCVTVITEAAKNSKLILGERDTLSFTMHDLIHADHFYFHNECYQGQLGLYGFLDKHQHDFKELMHTEFSGEFEYLIADMNAYAVHSLKCLKAAIIYHGDDETFERWAEKFAVKEELKLLNSPLYNPHESDHKLLNWLGDYALTI